MDTERKTYTAFVGEKQLVSGDLETTVRRMKQRFDRGEERPVLAFEDQTGNQIDFDLRGSVDAVIARLATHPAVGEPARGGPGRPKLGVVSREVTLLPRHWEWLEQQQGGISSALRKLVEEARKRDPAAERARLARNAAGKFMWAIAGNLSGFEEATRALFAKDDARLAELIRRWPIDIRKHVLRLVSAAAGGESA